jgi:multiple sugar transport system ATP-binding protein
MAEKIVLADIEKSFITFRGRVDVLQKISLTIKPQEFFVLLGPSGCGKSTLLNLIAGLEKPSAGSITIGEKAVADTARKIFIDPFHRDVAMVFQSYALYPHMSVYGNIAFPLTNIRPKLAKQDIDAKVRKAAGLLQIETLLDRKPAELSGGQRQRVAIGRAVVREPKVFLMDEPLSNLDAQLRTRMRAQLKDLQKRLGITTLYVTHDQMEAMTLGDRIAILNDGAIQQLGTPGDVYDNPTNAFVARFIGSPPMNLIEGDVEIADKKAILRTPDADIFLPDEIAAQLQIKNLTTCILGIRPEHIELVEPGGGNMNADIAVTENIGAEYLAYIFLKNHQVVIRSATKPAATHCGLKFMPDKIHLF